MADKVMHVRDSAGYTTPVKLIELPDGTYAIGAVAGARKLIKATHTAINVGVSSTEVLAANPKRQYAIFINDSDSIIYLMFGATAEASNGIRINANGGSYEMSPGLGNLWTGTVNAIHGGTGSLTLLVMEGE